MQICSLIVIKTFLLNKSFVLIRSMYEYTCLFWQSTEQTVEFNDTRFSNNYTLNTENLHHYLKFYLFKILKQISVKKLHHHFIAILTTFFANISFVFHN